MLRKISAVAGAFIIAGCVSTQTPQNTSAPVVTEKKPSASTANNHQHAASAEQIANRLWGQTQEIVTPEPAELEDLWQRIQMQMTFNVPQTRPIVEQRNFFTRHQAYLDRVANRAQPFLYYIVQELEKRNMPLELALLPIVESAFDPFAHSHAAASGMWQFMPATGKRFGLKQNAWYDGRRDVIQSTRAALEYLQYLHDKLEGDWLNAIAAYNSGEGRILAAIKRNKEKRLPTDFWSLDLPAETTAYVPKLLALVDMLKRPEEFDIVWKFIPNEPKIDIVEVGKQIDLAIAAEMAGMSIAELQALNPGYSKWATAPDGPHAIVLPIEQVESFSQKVSNATSKDLLRFKPYTVKNGDTLDKIAKQHGMTISAITSTNQLKNNIIRVGQNLLLPMSSETNANYTLSQSNRLASAQQRASAGKNKIEYIVKEGDTLWDISREHKVTVNDLTKWNSIAKNGALKPGQKLAIIKDVTPSDKTASTGVSRTVTYKVRKGDSLAKIAQRFNITVSDIVKWNNINTSNFLQPGQQLKLQLNLTSV